MKKILLLILITFFSCDFAIAQTNIANPLTNSKLTAVPANPENWYMEVVDWNNVVNPMISVISFSQLMTLLSISGDQTILDTWRFNKDLKLPPQAPTVSNEAGFIYQDGLNVYFIQRVWNGTGYDYAAQRLITKSEADSLYALSEAGLDAGYINTSTNQSAIAGNKSTLGIWQFDKIRILGGSTSLPAASVKNQLGIIESGANVGLYRSDASLAWVKISGDGTGGLPSTGSFSGATSTITWSSGTLTPYILMANRTVIRESSTPLTESEIVYHGSAGLTRGIHIKDIGDGNLFIPDETNVKTFIKTEGIDYTSPSSTTAEAVTISFNSNKTAQYIVEQDNEAPVITFTNMAVGKTASFIINNCTEPVVLTASGWTVHYPQISTPTFEDGKQYKIFAECMDNNEIWVHPIWR